MHVYQNGTHSLEEYWQIRENNEALLEYIDGVIYMSPSPSTKHQRVSRKLGKAFEEFLDGKSCELFYAPYDIELKSEKVDGTRIVIPDITIICDPSGFTDARYVGVPDLLVEILSPSNQSHDLITKLNLYMNYSVKEYWIVNPMLDTITVYTLNGNGMYEQHDVKVSMGLITSKLFADFQLDLTEVY